MLTFTLERRNIVCVMLWERSSIKNPNEDQYLRTPSERYRVVVMRTKLIVIVFLKLMGCISSFDELSFGRKETCDDMTMKTLHHDHSRYLDYECAKLQL